MHKCDLSPPNLYSFSINYTRNIIIMSINNTTMDYSNTYVHTGKLPTSVITNLTQPLNGYPKLERLKSLKQKQLDKHMTKPYGYRCDSKKIPGVLNKWITEHRLQFDVIMIGALEHKPIVPILEELPLTKLCSRPGFLFIWTTQEEIKALDHVLNRRYNKKFRRSEELIFVPVSKESKLYPSQDPGSLFENQQWHCWMCITGTVRRSLDQHLIHCNVDTDLQFEDDNKSTNAVPNCMYKIAENFSNLNRRLHIIPYHVTGAHTIKSRPGWVIMSPDILINNFTPAKYSADLYLKSYITYKNNQVQYLVSQTNEIEQIRPKSPSKS